MPPVSPAALSVLHARFDVPPYRLSGTVYGALLNHAPQLAALGEALTAPPHKAAPVAPVLCVMPRHTLAGSGEVLVVPADAPGLEIGVALGIVIGRVACRVPVHAALDHVAGYLVVGDISLPLTSHYRPAVRLRARDGFSPLGPVVTPALAVVDPGALAVTVHIDGQLAHRSDTGDRLRGVAQLLADVTDFMTLQPGDVLALGRSHGAPLARAGQTVVMEIAGLGRLEHRVVAEVLPAAPAGEGA
jgi:5-oxopent-3-ene-1,2,5-tricarboxylate decarboxylase/2-hydroxyhepta-2,4-diene-1,7-dioate isomerase